MPIARMSREQRPRILRTSSEGGRIGRKNYSRHSFHRHLPIPRPWLRMWLRREWRRWWLRRSHRSLHRQMSATDLLYLYNVATPEERAAILNRLPRLDRARAYTQAEFCAAIEAHLEADDNATRDDDDPR